MAEFSDDDLVTETFEVLGEAEDDPRRHAAIVTSVVGNLLAYMAANPKSFPEGVSAVAPAEVFDRLKHGV